MNTNTTSRKYPLSRRLKLRLNKFEGRYAGRFGKRPQQKKRLFIISCTNSGSVVLHELLAAQPEIASMHFEGRHRQDQLLHPAEHGASCSWALTPKYRLDKKCAGGIDADRNKRKNPPLIKAVARDNQERFGDLRESEAVVAITVQFGFLRNST